MAEKKRVITNQAAIDAANRANAAAVQRQAALQAEAARQQAIVAPTAQKAIPGISALNQAIQSKISQIESQSMGLTPYDPLTGKPIDYGTKSSTLQKQAKDILGAITPEEISTANTAAANYQKALEQAGNIQFVNVPSPIYSEEKTDITGKTSAYDLLNEFKLLGLDSLLEDIKRLIIDGVGDDQLLLEIRKTPAWQKRFAANKTRLAKGLRALSEGEYIDLETKYQDIMRNYGLPASYYSKTATGTNESFEKLIGGNVSPVKLEERIMIGTDRVLNKSPFITTALKQFYPNITNGDILAYVLDPDRGLDEIKRKVTAAEIGGAALGARLATDVGRAEELARYGVTAETARAGFGAIGSGLERGRQLASIYQQPDYTQAIAEEEVFDLPGQTSAREKRKKIIGLEEATFGGQTGLTAGALSRDRAGQY